MTDYFPVPIIEHMHNSVIWQEIYTVQYVFVQQNKLKILPKNIKPGFDFMIGIYSAKVMLLHTQKYYSGFVDE